MGKHGKKVTTQQREMMLDLLESNVKLVNGRFSSSVSSDDRKELWVNIAATLNSEGGGAVKEWVRWRKSWQDWKSKVKAKALALKGPKIGRGGTGGGTLTADQLTTLELRVKAFIADISIEGTPGVEELGLADESSEDENVNPQPRENSEIQQDKNPMQQARKKRLIVADEADLDTRASTSTAVQQEQPQDERTRPSTSKVFLPTPSANAAQLCGVLKGFNEKQDKVQELKEKKIEVMTATNELKEREIQLLERRVVAIETIALTLQNLNEYLPKMLLSLTNREV